MEFSFNHCGLQLKNKFFIFILLLLGCSPQLYWAKPNAGSEDFEDDARQCREELISSSYHTETSGSLSHFFKNSEDAMGQCLMSKGWILAEKP